MEHMQPTSMLVFDGDCGICREWVDYWRRLTGDGVQYRPYQEVAGDYPDIPLEDFQQSIQLIETDGTITCGAQATYKLYRGIHPYSLLSVLYKYLPGFALLSEAAYRFFSSHRGLLAFITHLFRGRNFQPSEYTLVTRIFLVLLGFIYLSAFFSFSVQAQALIGSDGILPLHFYLDRVREHYGNTAFLHEPMIFWLNASNRAIQLTCVAGCLASLLLIFNVFRIPVLILLYILYLSLYYAGQNFMTFQWDILLLEAGFLAIFLGKGSRIVVWLYRWLVFRFMLLGGLVKLASRDPTWDNLTALFYHFETQPLPTPLAWHAHHLSDSVLITLAGLTFFVELLVPLLVFTPRRFRFIGAWFIILFQLGILLTGNYNFFNLLTISMCVFLFDDAAFRRVFRTSPASGSVSGLTMPVNAAFILRCFLACIIVIASTEKLARLAFMDRSGEVSILTRAVSPLVITNNYGPFAIMTTVRNEIIVEGSNDGTEWREYRFRYKPGTLDKPLGFNIPHQPRVDWQMWFAALSSADRQPWFRRFLYLCLEGEARVLDILEHNPFPESPPRFIRALKYRYEFTTPEERGRSGNIWKRELAGVYQPARQLRSTHR